MTQRKANTVPRETKQILNEAKTNFEKIRQISSEQKEGGKASGTKRQLCGAGSERTLGVNSVVCIQTLMFNITHLNLLSFPSVMFFQ